MAKLKMLKQTFSMNNYINKFDTVSRTLDAKEKDLIDMFIVGTKVEFHFFLMGNHPANLEQAYALARKICVEKERKNKIRKQSFFNTVKLS